MVKLPKGIKEEDFLEILEKAVADATRNFGVAYYESDDLKQEARAFALEAISKFRANKGSLYTFLRTHIHNRLINLKRDIEFRPHSPCSACEYHNIGSSPTDRFNGCSTYEDRAECIKWVKWMRTNTAKRNLSSPSPENNTEDFSDNIVMDDIFKTELKTLISRSIPNSLRADYLKMSDGISIPIRRRTKVIEFLKKLLLNNRGENGT